MKSFIKIGRDSSNDIVINEPRVSRYHATITRIDDDTFEVKDLGSTNGTFVNGNRITKETIQKADELKVGNSMVNWYEEFINPTLKQSQSEILEKPFAKIYKTINIGSSDENDIVISEVFVSKYHAKLSLLKNNHYFIQDLGSTNGTYVNGAKVLAKNFIKTDVVKIATYDLPENWFRYEKLRPKYFKDNKRRLIITFSSLILVAASILIYMNRCSWFGWGCNMSSEEIYSIYKNGIVNIEHNYYYTIETNGIKYFVGKNSQFGVTEANINKEHLLPYGKTTGNGCFINNDGTILTSLFISNPWLNDTEKNKMLKEVIDSKTIPHFSGGESYTICGETSELKWILSGLVKNTQNYVNASPLKIQCMFSDSGNVLIQSIKKVLPENGNNIDYFFNEKSKEKFHTTTGYFYSSIYKQKENSVIKDTFYFSKDSLRINKSGITPLPQKLDSFVSEGSIVLNKRGELIGIVQQGQITLITRFIHQLKK